MTKIQLTKTSQSTCNKLKHESTFRYPFCQLRQI